MPFSNPITAGTILVQPAIRSPNYVPGVSGWSINVDGSAEFDNLTFRGTFNGTDFIINSAGAFFYSSTPAAGNLIASIAITFGTDTFGNTVKPGFCSYSTAGQTFAELFGNELQLGSSNPASLIGTSGLVFMEDATTGPAQPVTQLQSPSTGVFAKTMVMALLGASHDGTKPAQLLIGPGAVSPATTAAVEVQGVLAALSMAISGAASTGHLLTIANSVSATGNPTVQLTAAAAADNMVGIQVAGDSSNRWKIDSNGMEQGGSGSTGQDVRKYRAAAGQYGMSTILADISGSPETWHTLGTLAGATVNLAQFRLLPTGMVHVDIDISFAVSTAWPSGVAFSVTIPAAYRPLGSVDVRAPMAQTNSAGGFGRIFVGSVGGGSAGQVQFASLNGGNVIGTYSAHFDYPVI